MNDPIVRGYEFLPYPLNKEDEEKLTIKAYEKDPEARKLLIEHNLRLVFFVSNKFKKNSSEKEDLTSVGTIGLIKAVNNFNPTKKIKLSTFAAKCIENEILMYLRKAKKHENEKSLQEAMNGHLKGKEVYVVDTLGTDKEEVEKIITKQVEYEIVKRMVQNLPDIEREIIQYRYGIGVEKKKQADIALLLNISQSYISRIEKKVISKLKNIYEQMTN